MLLVEKEPSTPMELATEVPPPLPMSMLLRVVRLPAATGFKRFNACVPFVELLTLK